MDVRETIEQRRAYRSLAPVEVTDELVRELAHAAQFAPTCSNNQPARLVFVRGAALDGLKPALNRGNAWAKAASMIIAVCCEKEADCVIHEREYYLFDAGMQTAFLILRATELGLVAHPIAGYKPELVRSALGIPQEVSVAALVIVGRHADELSPVLSEEQAEVEKRRPERLPMDQVALFDRWPVKP